MWEHGFCPACGEMTGLCGLGRTVVFGWEQVLIVRLPHPRGYCTKAETGTGGVRILTRDGPVDTGPCAAHEGALASVAAASGVPVWRIPPARPRPRLPARLRAVVAAAWYRAFHGAPGGPTTAGGRG